MIFRRQRAVLGLLLLSKKKLTRLELIKWLFLLKKETPISRDLSFYDFLPYRFGPYSFTLVREIEELSQLGFIDIAQLKINPWIREQVGLQYSSLPADYRTVIESQMETFNRLTRAELIQYVYNRYPWYASRSELNNKAPGINRGHSKVRAVYTLGYEKESVESFFEKLLQEGIQCVVDVRNNPISRKFGFSRRALENFSNKMAMKYYHFPDLGVPTCMRASLETEGNYEHIFQRYETEILSKSTEKRREINRICENNRAVLVCYEKNEVLCHRHRLAMAIARDTELPIRHL